MDILLRNKVNELQVARNEKCQLVVRQDLIESLDHYQIYLQEIVTNKSRLSKSSHYSSALLSIAKRQYSNHKTPRMMNITNVIYQARSNKAQDKPQGLSLLNL
jgi:hypothetical protein